MLNSIHCFLKASIILNVKVVPNDIFKFGSERVNERTDTVIECPANNLFIERNYIAIAIYEPISDGDTNISVVL